ncbi:hypothetical protein [Mucilaginibacter agri]|uniref:Uncharacterized protein n=1 Tax=Mucilaginibacter agri TaxID=2695265 RepID=A0A965ZKI0_9SPHI|nr:hypothetical protein [Mucilaginibacter agri]NCD71698.1 hypothetical protein [Mucilaginibacter agri]
MKFNKENIYELLPSIYRIRDAELNYPLKALIEIIAEQASVMQDNIAGLYDNWFIETCEEWVVPYIGDLLGVQNFHTIAGSPVSPRAYIANTLRYRRRKGIAPVLEQLAQDTTGLRAHVVEFFELLQTSQYLNHIRLQHPLTPDLRNMQQLANINTAFDTIAHTADVRHIASGRGEFNIPNIGLFIWRIQDYPLARVDAYRTVCIPDSPPSSPVSSVTNLFIFNPLGNDLNLFNNPVTKTEITYISTELNVPGLLQRRALYDELEARRQALVDGTALVYGYFNNQLEIEDDPTTARHPVFEIFANGADTAVPPEEILICNLAKCCTPPSKQSYPRLNSDGTYTLINKKITVAVDPVLGRFMFTDSSITSALVNYSYGFSGDVGGGPYSRQDTIPLIFQKKQAADSKATVTWQAGVSKTETGTGIFDTIQKALDEWNGLNAGATGIIAIMDSRSYFEDLNIVIKEKSNLLIIAADWPQRIVDDSLPGETERIDGDIIADDLRPHIAGDIKITGVVSGADIERDDCGELTLNGLLIDGKVSVLKGCLGELDLVHCTVVPYKKGVEIIAGVVEEESNEWLSVNITKSICGYVNLNNTNAVLLSAQDSIIDSDIGTGFSISATNTAIQLVRVTAFGKTLAKTIEADGCIFNDTVTAQRRQAGCMRFCYIPIKNSQTPRKYHCQPDLEINTETDEQSTTTTLSDAEKNDIITQVSGWLVPAFTSVNYKDYGYGQLSNNCPVQITAGADNGSEMGVFNFLQQPQRRSNLQIALSEYLPVSMEAGVIYVT